MARLYRHVLVMVFVIHVWLPQRDGIRTVTATQNQPPTIDNKTGEWSWDPTRVLNMSDTKLIDARGEQLWLTPSFDRVAVVVIGGAGREAHASAVFNTWGKTFRNKIYITNVAPSKHFSPDLKSASINVFERYPTEEEQLNHFMHPNHPWLRYRGSRHEGAHSIQWQLGQPRYLLGLEQLFKRYSNMDWYIIADSDTYIYPHRILELLKANNPDEPVALGSLFKRKEPDHTLSCLLGGSGTVLSRAAMHSMDFPKCLTAQNENITWNSRGSDWRVGLCLAHAKVQFKDATFMLMVNEKFECGEHTGLKQSQCQLYKRIYRYPWALQCPYSLHYVAPEVSHRLYVETQQSKVLCTPYKSIKSAKCACTDLNTAIC